MKYTLIFLIFSIFYVPLKAQEDSLLIHVLNELTTERSYTSSAFKGTRLINCSTIECLGKNTLEFRVGHRFDEVKGGGETFWGLDNANMNITLDYSFTNRLTIGVGRNSFQKLYEGTVKYKILRQTMNNSMPVSLVVLGKGNSLSNTKGPQYEDPINQFSYFAELIICRKFNKALSLQISPSFIHINLIPEQLKSNDILAITGSARYKFTKSVAFTAEYTQTLNDYYYTELVSYIPTFSAGFDLETGGHVFQLFFTNSMALNETQYIPFTTEDWGRNQFRFGFNISRTFGIGHRSKKGSY